MDDFMINRTDGTGRSIYLQDRPAAAPTVIFTGAPGMGKSYSLGRATEAARRNGDLVFRIDAGSREPLEQRLARAVHDQYNELAETNGDRVLSDIGRLADRLLGVRGGWAERALTALAPVLQRAISWWEAPAKPSLTELVDRLGDLAQRRNKRLLLAIDNLGAHKEADLAEVTGLAEHLESKRGPIQLLVGASGPAVDALLTADSPGPTARIGTRYDIRDCAPVPEAELKRALLASLHRHGAAVRAEAATRLVREANGDPGHLMALADHAVALADSTRGVSRAVAEEAIRAKRSADQWAYRASWAALSDDARMVVTSALTQAKGAALDEPSMPTDVRSLVDRARTVADLVDAGILRRQGDRLQISDPGFQEWLSVNVAPHPLPSSVGKPARRARSTHQSHSTAESRTAHTGAAAVHAQRTATGTTATGATAPGRAATRSTRSPTGRAAGTASTSTRTTARTTSANRRRTRVAGHQSRGHGRG
jgi:hypothetical protein